MKKILVYSYEDDNGKHIMKPGSHSIAYVLTDSLINVQEWFEELYDEEHNNFGMIQEKVSLRRDVHAFVLLDRIFGGSMCMVACAEHDEIFLDPTPEQISKLTKDQVIELVRCGVHYNCENDCLCMSV